MEDAASDSDRPRSPTAPVLDRRVAAAVLGAAGLMLAAGALLHPPLPSGAAGAEASMQAIWEADGWQASHWALTVGQLVALAGLPWLARRFGGGLATAGAVLAGAGFLLGALGTMVAATALYVASAGPAPAFGTWNALALGLGWACIAVTGAGALLVGVAGSRHPSTRKAGWALAGGAAPILLAAAVFRADYPSLHDPVLRYSALFAGAVLLAAATWAAMDKASN